jgi:hypothetical protein
MDNYNILNTLQPRQIEWLYWLSQGENQYSAASKMGVSHSSDSISLRQKSIRLKLNLSRNYSLKIIAINNKKWLIDNVKIKKCDVV